MLRNTHSIEIFKEIENTGIDARPIFAVLIDVIELGKYKILDDDAAKEIAQKSGAPVETVIKIFEAIQIRMDRGLTVGRSGESKPWDGIIPLSHLFKGELIPQNTDEYLDQRFLDYLAANNEEIEKMYWRNFERLCAEFFSRLGYEVELGPGTADGGVDEKNQLGSGLHT